jgi:hypothetical protein
MTDKVLEAVREASISIACLYDWLDDTAGINLSEYQKDIEHIQDQITILEDYLGAKYHDFETKDILLNTWLQNYRR